MTANMIAMPAAIMTWAAVPRNRCDGCVGSALRATKYRYSHHPTATVNPMAHNQFNPVMNGGSPTPCAADGASGMSMPGMLAADEPWCAAGSPPEAVPSAGVGSRPPPMTAYIQAMANIIAA